MVNVNTNVRFKSLPLYISPQTSFKSLKLGIFTLHENNILNTFGLNSHHKTENIVYLMRQTNMSPGQRLHFFEGIFESHFPWLLEYMELFWDCCGFHKYVYTKNHQCKNIFEYHNCKYYYPYQKKRCLDCERENIMSEIKKSKERYLLLF